jgi:hypothetical protein
MAIAVRRSIVLSSQRQARFAGLDLVELNMTGVVTNKI